MIPLLVVLFFFALTGLAYWSFYRLLWREEHDSR